MSLAFAVERSWRYDINFPLLSHLPVKWAYQGARLQARYRARQKTAQADLIRTQMQSAFPHATDEQLANCLADYFCMVEQEALDTWFINKPACARLVSLQNFELVQAARAAGRRVLLTGGHFGRFWLAGFAMRQAGFTVGTITRDGGKENTQGLPEAEYRYRLFKLQRLQHALGGPFLVEGDDLRPLYTALDEHLITLIFDVPYLEIPPGCVTVPFLGGNIKVPVGIYRIAKKTKALVAPFYMRDLGGGQVVAEFSALLDPCYYNDNGEGFMSHLTCQLEAQIRLRPGHWWLWEALPLLRR
ncbi:MAG: lipid A biosynthesis acyltransferase [Proteobacteria bacterium]|nr:MAG: lipid A biosynthesis acyltransferase [Pseudomonadota bacterium]